MHIILLPLVWTHLISAGSFALKPQVRHIYIFSPNALLPGVLQKLQCVTRDSHLGFDVLEKISQVLQLKCIQFLFYLSLIVLLIRYEKPQSSPNPNEECEAKKKKK